ncbi:ribulose-bisphosphate carboxylase large subunit family protein [Achromobacter xylosoxidans]|uniref:ribulose-bisphosphate carboxylase large subunit family protein n=1 Tax=Alcaligenes xylosoxydans xylosoxydans TaxID=85698 RepID=UPI0006C02733|nr:ribulose-bisphosphate carboxylase large subunit family protein [Achromobacter xylosoxidans]KWU22554.1 ribulose 1,5-bisphosphate carboxylase [Achromobacter xylosoxidans]MBK1981202.1 ribulose-bisphosphate carboxylase large subunit family protein [Achromobacter xylosoxidans]MCH4573677.1 ribulose-bisphosphate carboxylase large subunit family protein [Achromobacter xylosoxidans]MDD7992100.1 ribulose-bisphosphate carboxylase large subunit family protein [Achromobacter xylosoxidans]OFO62176.1 ribu
MNTQVIRATYLIETPLDPARVAEVMAGEQSCGTFTRVEGETDELRARARAQVESVQELESARQASLPNAWLARQPSGMPAVLRRARVRIAFPVANIGPNLPTLAATVGGNLYDLGEVTGLRLEQLELPSDYRAQFEMPRVGVAGTRQLTGVASGALVGTIIKPNVGLSPEQTAHLVARLCAAGVDFIKDDEVCANPAHAPLAQRVAAVMAVVRAHRERTGRQVMVAFNITDETDAMRRHADLIEREQGSCVMASLNWCGHSAIQTLRRHTPLALHGHRNGYGALSRHPLLGIGFQAYQTLWRLAGVDHMHVHGLQGKFSQPDAEVVESARDCLAPLTPGIDDAVMPAFSSGQWAGTVPATWAAVRTDDLLFMSGGGILAHPDGPAAGVQSIRQAWQAVRAGQDLAAFAAEAPELRRALAHFGSRA